MKIALSSCLLALLAVGVFAQPTSATTPTFAYTSNFSCLNSTSGFESNFTPKKGGTAWTEIIQGVASFTANGNTFTITELDTSIVTAVFGTNPKSDGPAASAITVNITSVASGPNPDGSSTLTATSISGSYTAGPNKGKTFTATTSGIALKSWSFSNGSSVSALTGPVVQTITLSDRTKYERVCTTILTEGPL